VAPYQRPGDADSPWIVIHTDGQALGAIDIPEGIEVLDIGREFIVGLHRDELEVEYVSLFRIEKMTSTSRLP
jgi:hypothetical protein